MKTKQRISLSKTKKAVHKTVKKASTPSEKRRTDALKAVCWVIVPIIVTALLVMDAFGIYAFNKERLIVVGAGFLILLLPFFSEITVKNISVKRTQSKDNGINEK